MKMRSSVGSYRCSRVLCFIVRFDERDILLSGRYAKFSRGDVHGTAIFGCGGHLAAMASTARLMMFQGVSVVSFVSGMCSAEERCSTMVRFNVGSGCVKKRRRSTTSSSINRYW